MLISDGDDDEDFWLKTEGIELNKGLEGPDGLLHNEGAAILTFSNSTLVVKLFDKYFS